MKQTFTLLVFVLITTVAFAQKVEKLKGSKTVTTENKATPVFTAVYIQDDLHVSFIKADSTGIETEADDNLHQALQVSNNGGILNVSLVQKISGFKKFEVKIYYTSELKSIEATGTSKLMILDEMKLDDITFKINDKAKLYLNLNAKIASIEANDNSSIELNSKTEKISFILSQNTALKALVATTELNVDQYQKSKSTFEGDAIDMKLRMDNNAKFIGKNMTAKNVELIAEGYSNTSIFAETNCVLNIFANAEIELFGEPTINVKKFTGNAVLMKKTLK